MSIAPAFVIRVNCPSTLYVRVTPLNVSSSPAGPSVAPPVARLMVPIAPAEGGFGSGAFSWSPVALPSGGTYVLYVDDDLLLGDGEPNANEPETGEPMRSVASDSGSADVAGLTLSRTYYWQVAAFDPAGAVVAGSKISTFVMSNGPFTDGGNVVDTTAPTAGVVNDGNGADIDVQQDQTSLAANWSGFADPQSGIALYEWALGTSPGGEEVQRFAPLGTAHSA